MQRKPGFPVANCSIKMPDGMPVSDQPPDEDSDQIQRRQQLINFGHSQWGFNNWSWSVTKQDLDFVDFSNGKFCVGVCAYVSVTVKSFDIHRENIGYATTLSPQKGAAIYRSRKCAVTNALRETLLSFGGSVATELMELLESNKTDHPTPTPLTEQPENNQNLANKPAEPRNSPVNKNIRKDSDSVVRMPSAPSVHSVHPPPIAKAHPMPANLPANRPPVLPANAPRPPQPTHPRPNNEARIEGMSEEEARAERKRRQQRAQEEFRQKMMQQNHGHTDEKPEAQSTSGVDSLLMEIPTQDIEIEQTGDDAGKRKSPAHDTTAKRRTLMSKLDIVTD